MDKNQYFEIIAQSAESAAGGINHRVRGFRLRRTGEPNFSRLNRNRLSLFHCTAFNLEKDRPGRISSVNRKIIPNSDNL